MGSTTKQSLSGMSMSAQLDCYGGQAKQMSVFANLTFLSSDLQVLMSIGVHYLI